MIRSDFRGRRRAERRVRFGLWFLALAALVPGVWAFFAPRAFFDDFPGMGTGWVSLHPPFNEHLVRDVGAFYAAFGVLFVIAALRRKRPLTIAALISWLVFAVGHFMFHLGNSAGEGVDVIAQLVALGVVIVVPVALLFAVRKSERSSF